MYKILIFVLLWGSCLFSFGQTPIDSIIAKASVEEAIDTPPVSSAEKMPEFVGGETALYDFLENELKYPKDALKKRKSGIVLIEFVVNVDGTVSDVKALTSVFPSIDKEAIRVIRKMPKWIPGEQDGEKVKCYFNIPIRFSLKK